MTMIGVVVDKFTPHRPGLDYIIMFPSSAGETVARRNRCDLPPHTTRTLAACSAAVADAYKISSNVN
jgi:hypothetical protein